jgi:hypothetical protein
MSRRTSVARTFALALALAGGLSCSGPKTQSVEVGHHRVRFLVPRGWEHLDHGRQQLFRLGEAEIELVDRGPANREGIAYELEAAESLWLAGYRRDAFQRVRELHGPVFRFASSDQRLEFWRPWTDATYIPDMADSAALGAAFEALIAGTAALNSVTPEQTSEYVLMFDSANQRREIGHRDLVKIHGAEWTVIETWDRVSHMNRARVAFLVSDGYLLVLATNRGLFEQTAPRFDELLHSFEVTPLPPAPR